MEFRLRVPEDARLSQRQSVWTWKVSVEADILWPVNPRALIKAEVVPHHEVTAVQRALESLGFAKTNVYIDFALRERPDTIVGYYRASIGIRDQIDGASLHLRVLGDHVHGRFILNRRRQSVGEHLLALVGADREEYTLQIPRFELLNPQGGPHPHSATTHLNQILSQALILPENADAKTLLRPSFGPPPDADTLLRPAAHAGSEVTDELLRSVNDVMM